ncbi:MAG TPA: hypothetical protein VN759_05910 [Pseudolysinimonas sp.]|nr:hypothetical protein [Pseudolysinimonas sp.]
MTVVAAPRRLAAWDVAISIVLLVLSYAAYWIGAVFALFSLALLDSCSGDCSAPTAGSAPFTTALLLFALGIVGTAGTIVLLVFRRRGWWAAAATLVLTLAGWLVGFMLGTQAVGG